MKKKDILLIVLALLAALVLYAGNALFAGDSPNQVVVTVDGKEVMRVSTMLNGVYFVPTENDGVNYVAVEDGAAYMQSANCRDQLCVNQGKTKSTGKQIVCLPHRVVVRLEKADGETVQDDLDVVVR